MRKFLFLLILISLALPSFANPTQKDYDLILTSEDIVVLPEDKNHFVMDGNGVHLFVKKRGNIQSVSLLVKSYNYNDPDLSLMRAKEKNSVNGNELRYSAGTKSTFRMERTPNALISSTTENNFFGECFHIYIPKKMYYGYVIQTQNECEFEDEMVVSVRAYSEKYCDLSSKFNDNFLLLKVSDWALEESFAQIAQNSDGKVLHIITLPELTQKLIDEIENLSEEDDTDLVFAIDATESMKDEFEELKKNWLSKFEKQMKKLPNIRIGLLLYKDYGDEYDFDGFPVKNFGFLKNAKAFSKNLKSVKVKGGGDKEEAVFEALYACATNFEWRSDVKRKIVLIGDAPPHQEKDAEYTSDDVLPIILQKEISVDCFLVAASNESSSR